MPRMLGSRVRKNNVTNSCTFGDRLTARPEGGSLAVGQKFYHDGNSKAGTDVQKERQLKRGDTGGRWESCPNAASYRLLSNPGGAGGTSLAPDPPIS